MEFLILMVVLLPIMLFFLLIINIGKVPPNTAIIIDRDTHYLKTVRRGFYFLLPKDVITTTISTHKMTKHYTNYFETHDGYTFSVGFVATYHAEDIDAVLAALQSSRRSIDDIIESSVYWAINDLNGRDISKLLLSEITPKLASEARELCIEIDDFSITSLHIAPNASNVKPFKPHLSGSSNSGPIKFK